VRRRPRPVDLGVAAALAGRALPGSMLADPTFREKLARAHVQPDMSGGMVGQWGQDIFDAVRDAPLGIADTARAIGLDYRDTIRRAQHGDLSGLGMPRTRRLAAATGHVVRSTVRHPLRHPGDTTLLLAGAVSAGLEASRVAMAARAFREARAASAPTIARAPVLVARTSILRPSPTDRLVLGLQADAKRLRSAPRRAAVTSAKKNALRKRAPALEVSDNVAVFGDRAEARRTLEARRILQEDALERHARSRRK
jgi:hypothetical protein